MQTALIHSKQRFSKAFTVVELLIVVAVIGILAVLAFLGYGAAQTSSRTAQVTADLQAANYTISRYQDQKGEFPIGSDCSASPAANTVCMKTVSGETVKTYYANSGASPQT